MKSYAYTARPIELEEALKIINGQITALTPRLTEAAESLGCVLAENIEAKTDFPPFPRSPYDGYGLKARQTTGASRANPQIFKVLGYSLAGKPFKGKVGDKQAIIIATGACIPPGVDCVIRQEDTDMGEQQVSIYTQAQPWDNYCQQGEDFVQGEVLGTKGEIISPALAAIGVAGGYDRLLCVPPVKVALLSGGTELYPNGLPLPPGHIYDSNGIYLTGRLRELGIANISSCLADDDTKGLAAAIMSGLENADVLITTGGVSVGLYDLIPRALQYLSADILFHGVRIKPGMPALLALLDNKPIVALSGNPFAAAVDFELLARPVLARLAANPRLLPEKRAAVLNQPYTKKGNMRRFVRARLSSGKIYIPPAQSNGQMRAMTECNCLLEIAAATQSLDLGQRVEAFML